VVTPIMTAPADSPGIVSRRMAVPRMCGIDGSKREGEHDPLGLDPEAGALDRGPVSRAG
jgi:hypothetical protein